MKSFRTILPQQSSFNVMNYSDSFFLIGSCFSDNIFQKMQHLHVKSYSNPYGVLFQPLAIFKALEEIITKKNYQKEDVIFHNSLYQSMQHHSDFTAMDAEKVLQHIHQEMKTAFEHLQDSHFLIITLGTAWVYEFEGKTVANCHKMPSQLFQKRLLTINEIVDSFNNLFVQLQALHPRIKIIFTLSPVRHIKDGFEENGLSKAILRAAIHEIQMQHAALEYFPAYEIMMDDLRDYRFYEADLLHPNNTAIDYIWEYFVTKYGSKEFQVLLARVEQFRKAQNHIPRFTESEAYQKHLAFVEQEQVALANLGVPF